MPPQSKLCLPPPALASCAAAAVYRDTTGVTLAAQDRLNYFPATPLFTVTRVFEGQLHMAKGVVDMQALTAQPPLARVSANPPHAYPICSWSPSGLRAATVAIYPDAWLALGGSLDAKTPPPAIMEAMTNASPAAPAFWSEVCAHLAPHWHQARQDRPPLIGGSGSHRLADWARHITTRAALSGTGRSMRSIERRLRHWTGQTAQSLAFFAKVEDLHVYRTQNPQASLAEIAAIADFSDQSHMGRAVKRATGFSPARLNQLIDTQEPFWCYRLLAERF
ncbi:MAG: helix-turn-helix domain-containing protein [Sulfitobacter sp.]